MYGKTRGGPADQTTLEHMDVRQSVTRLLRSHNGHLLQELAPSVEELKVLEKIVQKNYVELLCKGMEDVIVSFCP